MLALASTLLFLAEFSLAIRVYLHPSPQTKFATTTASPTQARLLVSHHLGLDSFDSWDDIDGSVWRVVNEAPIVGSAPPRALVLTVGEDVAADIIPSSLKPSFSVSDPPAVAVEMSSTLNAFALRAEHVYSKIYSPMSDSPLPPLPRLIDIFSASPSDATESFLSEMAQLVSFVESEENDSFGAFELLSLADVANEYGRDSEHYTLAAETANAVLLSAISSPKLHLALLTYPASAQSSKRQSNTSNFAQPPQSPLPPPVPSPQLPIGGVSTCFETEEACNDGTDSCSGRGTCSSASKAGRTCFVCACEVTTDDEGRRTWWAGDSCEKRDVSTSFTLITGTIIALLILAGGSVSLLSSIGDQKLPPTLTASTVGGHLKRD